MYAEMAGKALSDGKILRINFYGSGANEEIRVKVLLVFMVSACAAAAIKSEELARALCRIYLLENRFMVGAQIA
jgi:hypothetical protein